MLTEHLTKIIGSLNDDDLTRLYEVASDEKRKRDYAKVSSMIVGDDPNPLTESEIAGIRKSYREIKRTLPIVKVLAESRGIRLLEAKRIVDVVLFGDD